jgi:hypothetical protein
LSNFRISLQTRQHCKIGSRFLSLREAGRLDI